MFSLLFLMIPGFPTKTFPKIYHNEVLISFTVYLCRGSPCDGVEGKGENKLLIGLQSWKSFSSCMTLGKSHYHSVSISPFSKMRLLGYL